VQPLSQVGHKKEQCFELVGYPPNWGNRRGLPANQGKGRGNLKIWGNENGGRDERQSSGTNKLRGGEAFLATGKSREEEDGDEGHARFDGLSKAQLEELYAYFKEKETQERMTGKRFSAGSMQWILDSGASHHMTNRINLIQNLVKLPEPIFITTTNNVTVMVEKARMVVVSPDIVLKNVLYSPEFSCNLISIRQLTKDVKCYVTYGERCCVI